MEPILEELPGAVHGLENVRHMAIKRLRDIPLRHAVVKGSATPSFDITTFLIDMPPVTERMVRNFTNAVLDRSPFTIPAQLAHDNLLTHQSHLFTAARSFTGSYAPSNIIEHPEDDDGLG